MKRLILILIAAITWCMAASAMSSDDIVIANFEGKDYGSWSVTGEAFGSTPARGTLPNQMPVFGYAGDGLANSFVNGDQTQGTLTSPEFRVERRFINFLIGGGRNPGRTCMNLLIGGSVVRTTTGANDEYLRWATWDVTEFLDRPARIEIVDHSTGGWGHVNIDRITQGDNPKSTLPEAIYNEKYRPQFHFTAKDNWLNDPNGLVYYGGEFHLFFQHNPTGIEWGNMTWGHAVSPDLVHWTELDDALHPDAMGTMFSGSAVVDWNNTSGFGTSKEKPLVAFYTAAGNESPESKGVPYTQCIAYSIDRGRTWTKYAKNPVVPHIRGGNRDPKVIWYEPEKKWIMILFTEEETYTLFESKNTREWTKLQDFHFPGHGECPDFYPMQIEGHEDAVKWILAAGNGDYFIGTFDGRQFRSESGPFTADYGSNYYAVQTYSDAPHGRRIQIAWMMGGQYPNMPFNQQMNFPTDLKLRSFPEGLRICRLPVKEIEGIRAEEYKFNGLTLKPGENPLSGITGDLLDIQAEIDVTSASEVGIMAMGEAINYSVKEKTLSCLGKSAPLDPVNGRIKLRILVDRTTIEVVANDGKVVMSSCFLPAPDKRELAVYAKGGPANIISLKVHKLKSTWARIEPGK